MKIHPPVKFQPGVMLHLTTDKPKRTPQSVNTTPYSFSEQGGTNISPGRNPQLNPKTFGLLFFGSTTKIRAHKQEQLDAPCRSVAYTHPSCCKKIPEKRLRGTCWSVRHMKRLFFSFPSCCEKKAKQQKQNVRDSIRTAEDTIFPRVSAFALPSSKGRDTVKNEAPEAVKVLQMRYRTWAFCFPNLQTGEKLKREEMLELNTKVYLFML